jgi:predicted phage gp36 major capsid-like protein
LKLLKNGRAAMPDPVTGTMIGSTVIGAVSSKNAADKQSAAAQRAADLQREQFDITNEQQRPWREAGGRALTKLESMAEYKPFDMATFQQDPSYQFRLDQGTKALERSAAARGGLVSGNTGGALTNYGQNAASQEYQNAFNRYQTERNASLAPYMTLAGYGTNANALSAQAGQNYANNAGNFLTGGAAAQAAGGIGMANALSGGVSQYLNYNQGNNLIDTLNRNRTYASVPSNAATTIPMQAGGGY